MKLYKVITGKNTAIKNEDFDYTEYLPKGKRKGKWLPEINNLSLCNSGYHVTLYWNMWYDKGYRIFEVECKGIISNDNEVGVVDKFVCKSFRFLKEVTLDCVKKLDNNINTGNRNTGDYNTGDYNTGNWNTGDYNTGNRNTGEDNTGNWNTGEDNTGNRNTGDYNTGNWNTGDYNTGNRNTGDYNTGDYNTGDYNTGNWNAGNRNARNKNTGDYNTGNKNTGDYNTGDYNTGDYNTGNWNAGDLWTGSFNVDRPESIFLFNKPISKQNYDKIIFPQWFYFELKKDYKKSWLDSFKRTTLEELEQTINLPNFDYDIFKQITGISKRQIVGRINKLKKG